MIKAIKKRMAESPEHEFDSDIEQYLRWSIRRIEHLESVILKVYEEANEDIIADIIEGEAGIL